MKEYKTLPINEDTLCDIFQGINDRININTFTYGSQIMTPEKIRQMRWEMVQGVYITLSETIPEFGGSLEMTDLDEEIDKKCDEFFGKGWDNKCSE